MFLTVIAGKAMDRLYEFIPFFLLAKNGGGGKVELNLSRILEAVIIAVITAAIIGWTMNGRIERIEKMLDKIYSDIYKPSVEAGP